MTRGYRKAQNYPVDSIIGIYDNGGKTTDRYTVVYAPYTVNGRHFFPYVHMSGAPYWPQGVCMHGSTEGYRLTGGWGSSLGKVIAFDDLPADCQRVAREDAA